MSLSTQGFVHRLRSPTLPKFLQACSSFLRDRRTSDSSRWADFSIIFEHDPAAHNWLEVLCCYPGLHAITAHRLAHWLYNHRVTLLPRLISHLSRFFTGIDIHPAAQLGRGVFIDHGMGVVIGETAIVGDYSLIYQGVTLGGTGKQTGKRHPTLAVASSSALGPKYSAIFRWATMLASVLAPWCSKMCPATARRWGFPVATSAIATLAKLP